MREIERFTFETLEAISALIRENRYLQALVVLYSAIDTFAWANVHTGNATRSDFMSWVDTYMDPAALGCSSQDLYAARCALLHSGAAESQLSREGKASQLWYVTGRGSSSSIEAIARKNAVAAKAINVTDLVAQLIKGAEDFQTELEANPTRANQVTQRIGQWLAFVPNQPSTPASDASDA